MKSSALRNDEQGLRLKHDAELRSMAVLRPMERHAELSGSARAELERRHLPVPTPAEYWRDLPQEWLAVMGFCYACWAQTSAESPGNVSTQRRLGIALSGEVDPCATCGSVVMSKAFWLGVPLVPLGQYRVLGSAGGAYRARKLEQPA